MLCSVDTSVIGACVRRGGVLLKLFGLCVLSGVLVASLMLPAAIGAGAMVNETTSAMSRMSDSLEEARMPLTTDVLDRNGDPIAHFYDDYRIPTSSDEIADTMRSAITAIEDKRFWDHNGVDWQGTMRALATNISSGSVQEGASTITQQYVKNYLVHVAADNKVERHDAQATTIARKLREARLAVELERTMSKDEILTSYLNVVPFGNQTFGVGAAAQTYFGISSDQLNIQQAALLAAIVNAPGALNPNSNPDAARERRNEVIDRMAQPNNNFRITKEDAERAKQQPLGVLHPLGRPPSSCVSAGGSATNGFFCSYLRDYLNEAGFSDKELENGGYTIHTTMDPEATKSAKKAAEAQVPKDSDNIANPMAIVEPGQNSHKVRALVANRDYGNDASKGQTAYNITTEVIPYGSGSVFKIFTAAAAIQQGWSPNDTIPVPSAYTTHQFGHGQQWTVHNAEGVSSGSRSLRDALATSPNTGFVWLLERVGLNNAVDMAEKLGLRHSLSRKVDADGDPETDKKVTKAKDIKQSRQGSFTLGVTPVSVLELSNVMATIASDGKWCPPTPVESITDRDGNPVQVNEKSCSQVVSPRTAHGLAQGLSDDHKAGGTSHAAAESAGWTRPLMAKTGTTQYYQSAVLVGATPQMAGAVMTYTDGPPYEGICVNGSAAPYQCSDTGGNLYGGTIPARTFYPAMNTVHEGLPVKQLPEF
ncbi:Membrane carboxypeptidase (penicillin-binding protein) [Actinopolyspora alba]|uniref:Membrane carboxypeptidase (Penicillin-binding protein) n=1 Tax=Actinopolyspora alba TaxID=673379 RepID=A0A1I1UN39_9ACTN|nr:Membrane carboxypeptidase (penicillin-binding protein) [Actinopolyspora alba]